jgi:hypothetical protein
MFNNNGYDLSDIAAVTGSGRNDGLMGDNGWWIILLFLLAFNGGWGNGGFGNSGRGQSEIAYSFDMNGLENGVRGIQ